MKPSRRVCATGSCLSNSTLCISFADCNPWSTLKSAIRSKSEATTWTQDACKDVSGHTKNNLIFIQGSNVYLFYSQRQSWKILTYNHLLATGSHNFWNQIATLAWPEEWIPCLGCSLTALSLLPAVKSPSKLFLLVLVPVSLSSPS